MHPFEIDLLGQVSCEFIEIQGSSFSKLSRTPFRIGSLTPHQTNHVVWDENDLSIKERIPVERRLIPQGSVMANVASGVGDYAEGAIPNTWLLRH